MADQSNGPILNGLPANLPDIDPDETAEWLQSLDDVNDTAGRRRARYLMLQLNQRARELGVGIPSLTVTDYINTIPPEREPYYPGDEVLERRYRSYLRWNSAILVHRAQRPGIGVGGHIASYASSSTMYEVGFNHFFRGQDHPGGGDQIYFQGHAAPGMYARALLEGRLSADQLDGFRQELSHPHGGMPSYPHPRLMKDFWQFPTVSMGLGPANAIYQAAFNKYMHLRGIKDTSQQHVWAFLGDGEMDEPESRGFLQLAALEELDNLTFVVNCNLQRLDGPVRGNGKIIQELEGTFRGAGWNVIKVIWGREWDMLLAQDSDNALVHLMNVTPDGDYQTFRAEDGAFIRENFFGRDPRTRRMVQGMSDADIWRLKRGGHDYHKMYAAYKAATEHNGQPTVILAKTIKGYGLGPSFAGRMAAHQMKKLTLEDLKSFRDDLKIPVTDAQLEENPYLPPYYNPGPESDEIQYLLDRRKALGGFLPERRSRFQVLTLPGDDAYRLAKKGSGKQQIATTMAFVRILKDIMRDKEVGRRIALIIPDEARTFGMDSFFPTLKIYNPHGQKYLSVDRELMLAYKESPQGQIIHVGINEAGAMAAFTAAGTSYATHGEPIIPVYIFYSMFGYQRTGDAMWAAADQMSRGFIVGATAGRTTLTGEGLQHADGHSPLLASTNPATVIYDPAFGYEIGHIMRDGLQRMYGEPVEGDDRPKDVMYYLTVYNEPMIQPAEPTGLDVDGLLKGAYLYRSAPEANGGDVNAEGNRVQLMASGVAMLWALEAQELLTKDFGIAADVWSVTSWTELRRDGLACDRDAFLNPTADPPTPFIAEQLAGRGGPVVAVSDYMRQVPDQIRQYVPNEFSSLGADGFGLSDTRPAVRRHFHIDGPSIAYQALRMLAARGAIAGDIPAKAFELYKLDDVTAGTSGSSGGDA